MFQSARLQLTLWYLLIIMVISIFFSITIYNLSDSEIQRVIRRVEFRHEHTDQAFPDLPPMSTPNISDLQETEQRLRIILLLINAGIFVLAGGAGYFLAGRTLRPIAEMVDEQNRFITDASHELLTPVTALRSEMEATLLENTITPQTAKKLIESNLEDVVQLQTLSHDLLQLAQSPSSKNKASFAEVSLSEILSEAQKKVHVLAKKKNIPISSTITDVSIQGQKQPLVQLFVILLDNAIKYSFKQGKITVRTEKVDHAVKIHIIDQGAGMTEEEVPHIFDRFYRIDKSRSKIDVSGYGLGLAIAKKIVTIHKGSMQVKSKLGKGTTFTIQLPVNST